VDADLWRRAAALFAEIAAAPKAERAEKLAAGAAGDPELRRVVERLLAADTGAEEDGFLESKAAAVVLSLPSSIGRYRIVERLGHGGYGEVFRAFDPVLKREVAIKTSFEEDAGERERFAREAEIVARLEHPNISRIYDFGSEGGVPYLVQELLAGEDLSQWIEHRPPVPLERRAAWLLDAARGLAHAHARGVVHRDVKPGNLRRLPDDTVKVLDFGIARHVDARQLSADVTGTLAYMAPERLRGRPGAEDAAAVDVYAWAAVAWELLAGRRRLGGESALAQVFEAVAGRAPELRRVAPDCPPDLAALVERGLDRDPARRPSDGRELVAALEPVVSALRRGERAPRARRRGWVIPAAAAVAAGVLGALWLARQQSPSLPPAAPARSVLRVDARPWARVLEIREARGREVAIAPRAFTPLGLAVAPGEYRVTMEAPSGEHRSCEARVGTGAVTTCALEFAPVDVDRFLAEALR
jgi:hypothetical protein